MTAGFRPIKNGIDFEAAVNLYLEKTTALHDACADHNEVFKAAGNAEARLYFSGSMQAHRELAKIFCDIFLEPTAPIDEDSSDA